MYIDGSTEEPRRVDVRRVVRVFCEMSAIGRLGGERNFPRTVGADTWYGETGNGRGGLWGRQRNVEDTEKISQIGMLRSRRRRRASCGRRILPA